MPVLVRLRYCVISMYFGDHNPPHFHVIGNDGQEAQIGIAGLRVLIGAVDRRALSEAMDWASANETFLRKTWDDFKNL